MSEVTGNAVILSAAKNPVAREKQILRCAQNDVFAALRMT